MKNQTETTKTVAVVAIVAIVQLVLHYLGWAGIVLGIVALVFGNWDRGTQLLFNGIGLIVVKYIIGFVFVKFADRRAG
jgi:hypothetical protein